MASPKHYFTRQKARLGNINIGNLSKLLLDPLKKRRRAVGGYQSDSESESDTNLKKIAIKLETELQYPKSESPCDSIPYGDEFDIQSEFQQLKNLPCVSDTHPEHLKFLYKIGGLESERGQDRDISGYRVDTTSDPQQDPDLSSAEQQDVGDSDTQSGNNSVSGAILSKDSVNLHVDKSNSSPVLNDNVTKVASHFPLPIKTSTPLPQNIAFDSSIPKNPLIKLSNIQQARSSLRKVSFQPIKEDPESDSSCCEEDLNLADTRVLSKVQSNTTFPLQPANSSKASLTKTLSHSKADIVDVDDGFGEIVKVDPFSGTNKHSEPTSNPNNTEASIGDILLGKFSKVESVDNLDGTKHKNKTAPSLSKRPSPVDTLLLRQQTHKTISSQTPSNTTSLLPGDFGTEDSTVRYSHTSHKVEFPHILENHPSGQDNTLKSPKLVSQDPILNNKSIDKISHQGIDSDSHISLPPSKTPSRNINKDKVNKDKTASELLVKMSAPEVATEAINHGTDGLAFTDRLLKQSEAEMHPVYKTIRPRIRKEVDCVDIDNRRIKSPCKEMGGYSDSDKGKDVPQTIDTSVLQGEISRLQDLIIQNKPSKAKFTPKRPNIFTGAPNEDYVKFRKKLLHYFDIMEFDDETRLKYMGEVLEKDAYQVFDSLETSQKDTVEKVLDELDKRYGPNASSELLFTQLFHEQQGQSSVFEYTVRIRDMLDALGVKDERMRLHHFLRGLKDSMRSEVVRSRPQTIEEAKNFALMLETTNLADNNEFTKLKSTIDDLTLALKQNNANMVNTKEMIKEAELERQAETEGQQRNNFLPQGQPHNNFQPQGQPHNNFQSQGQLHNNFQPQGQPYNTQAQGQPQGNNYRDFPGNSYGQNYQTAYNPRGYNQNHWRGPPQIQPGPPRNPFQNRFGFANNNQRPNYHNGNRFQNYNNYNEDLFCFNCQQRHPLGKHTRPFGGGPSNKYCNFHGSYTHGDNECRAQQNGLGGSQTQGEQNKQQLN